MSGNIFVSSYLLVLLGDVVLGKLGQFDEFRFHLGFIVTVGHVDQDLRGRVEHAFIFHLPGKIEIIILSGFIIRCLAQLQGESYKTKPG